MHTLPRGLRRLSGVGVGVCADRTVASRSMPTTWVRPKFEKRLANADIDDATIPVPPGRGFSRLMDGPLETDLHLHMGSSVGGGWQFPS